MALNAASHNPTSEPTGSPSGPPPPVSSSLAEKIQSSTKSDPMGQNEGGQDSKGNNEGQKVVGKAGKEVIPGEGEMDGKTDL